MGLGLSLWLLLVLAGVCIEGFCVCIQGTEEQTPIVPKGTMLADSNTVGVAVVGVGVLVHVFLGVVMTW